MKNYKLFLEGILDGFKKETTTVYMDELGGTYVQEIEPIGNKLLIKVADIPTPVRTSKPRNYYIVTATLKDKSANIDDEDILGAQVVDVTTEKPFTMLIAAGDSEIEFTVHDVDKLKKIGN